MLAALFTRSSLAPPPPCKKAETGRCPAPKSPGARIDCAGLECQRPPAMSDQSQRRPARTSELLEPVHMGKAPETVGFWTVYLVLFLRIMAVISLGKGLYHWGAVCGVG